MRYLLRASYYRYFTSPLTWCAALAVLIPALISAWKTSDPTYHYITIDDYFFILSIAAGAVVISLISGREFCDCTIRNKITCGLSKAQIFLSECISCCTVMTVFYLITVIPLICFSIGGLKLLPAGTPVLLFVILWLVWLSGAVITVTCCFLSANRTYGVLIAGGVLFLLYLSGFWIQRQLEIRKDEYMTISELVYDGINDSEPAVIEHNERNPYHLSESAYDLIRYASTADPSFVMQEAIKYIRISNAVIAEALYAQAKEASAVADAALKQEQEKKEKEMQKDTDLLPFLILGQCGFIVLLTGCSVFIFRRKNLA